MYRTEYLKKEDAFTRTRNPEEFKGAVKFGMVRDPEAEIKDFLFRIDETRSRRSSPNTPEDTILMYQDRMAVMPRGCGAVQFFQGKLDTMILIMDQPAMLRAEVKSLNALWKTRITFEGRETTLQAMYLEATEPISECPWVGRKRSHDKDDDDNTRGDSGYSGGSEDGGDGPKRPRSHRGGGRQGDAPACAPSHAFALSGSVAAIPKVVVCGGMNDDDVSIITFPPEHDTSCVSCHDISERSGKAIPCIIEIDKGYDNACAGRPSRKFTRVHGKYMDADQVGMYSGENHDHVMSVSSDVASPEDVDRDKSTLQRSSSPRQRPDTTSLQKTMRSTASQTVATSQSDEEYDEDDNNNGVVCPLVLASHLAS